MKKELKKWGKRIKMNEGMNDGGKQEWELGREGRKETGETGRSWNSVWKEEKSAKGEMDGETEWRTGEREKTSIPSQEMMKRGTEWGGDKRGRKWVCEEEKEHDKKGLKEVKENENHQEVNSR